jgi:Arc/MetJ-type ribon-helix-helix transcriptional regulator
VNPKLVPSSMSTQIAVRLPDELVEYIDELVEQRAVKSRAEFVAKAISRERRHRSALADAEILKRVGADFELDALAAYQAAHPFELD